MHLRPASADTKTAARAPRVLVVATRVTSLPAAFALRLLASGIRVGAVSPVSPFLAAVPLDLRLETRGGRVKDLTRRAIRDFRPDLIVPCDDYAASLLHRFHAEWRAASDAGAADLIAASLGDPSSYDIIRNRSQLLTLATELAISAPPTFAVASAEEAATALAALGGAAIVKSDASYGGLGVHRASTVPEVLVFLAQVSRPHGLARAFKDTLRVGNALPFAERRDFQRPIVTAQKMIAGYPANRAVLCERGRVLGGITVRVRATMPNNGPASVVETIRHEQIADDVTTLVARLGLSGFHGFDFMIDADDRSWLLEINPRVTPAACFFAESASPLAALLHRHLAGKTTEAADPPAGQLIVMFPQELQRDATSPLLLTPHHHVPWSEPKFVLTCLDRALMPTRYEQVRRFLRRAEAI